MAQEILINYTPEEVRVALLEQGVLQEVHIERRKYRRALGNIYLGRVKRLLPGIQSAFIDIGMERAAFLHISDLKPQDHETAQPDIRDFLKVGQPILVQAYKEPLGTKGARVTTQFTIPARYIVLTPGNFQILVSQKISDENERQRLAEMLQPGQHGGYIFRTVAEGISATELEQDCKWLDATWAEIEKRKSQAKIGDVVYEELPIISRVLRDLASCDVTRIQIDDADAATKMREFSRSYIPELTNLIEYYDGVTPLFDIFSVENELKQALLRKVSLKSGAYIVIDQTEAMATIDVNSGSCAGHDHSEQMIYNINLEAAREIAHQVRLRNLGGIIIIDFIDLTSLTDKSQLIDALRQFLAKDSAKTEVSELSSLGLVQMTRKRTRESLENVLCVPCPLCQKRGSIKSVTTVVYEIFRQLQNAKQYASWPGIVVLASKEVIEFIKNETAILANLELQLKKPLEWRIETSFQQEQYNILPL